MPSEQESIWLATLTEADRAALTKPQSSPALPNPDVLILGGGIVALAVAYFAAERGAKVQVLAESPFAGDADASLGCIIPNACGWQFAAATQPLAQASRDWWAKLAVRPEFQLDWRVCGALMVDAERLQPDPRTHMLAALDDGYSVHEVDAEQIALLEPQLATYPSGGLHYPSEAVVHPLRAACGLIRGLRKRGGQITVGTPTSLQLEAGRVTTIKTPAGNIHPKFVFSDDVALLSRLSPDVASHLPKFEVAHRTLLSSGPQSAILHRPVLGPSWMVQLKSGETVIEVPQAGGTDATTDLLARWRQQLPALADVDYSRRWEATSERSTDAIPVVDQVPLTDNMWYSGGLDSASVLFAPIIGKSIADWILQGKPADDLTVCAAR